MQLFVLVGPLLLGCGGSEEQVQADGGIGEEECEPPAGSSQLESEQVFGTGLTLDCLAEPIYATSGEVIPVAESEEELLSYFDAERCPELAAPEEIDFDAERVALAHIRTSPGASLEFAAETSESATLGIFLPTSGAGGDSLLLIALPDAPVPVIASLCRETCDDECPPRA